MLSNDKCYQILKQHHQNIIMPSKLYQLFCNNMWLRHNSCSTTIWKSSTFYLAFITLVRIFISYLFCHCRFIYNLYPWAKIKLKQGLKLPVAKLSKRVFIWDLILCELKNFNFSVWSISYNCLHDKTQNMIGELT